jgi:hypothetical protein
MTRNKLIKAIEKFFEEDTEIRSRMDDENLDSSMVIYFLKRALEKIDY